MKTVIPPGQRAKMGYFNLLQCIASPIARENQIHNFPGSDYTAHQPFKDPKLSRNHIIINLHRLFAHCINPIVRKFRGEIGLTSVYRNRQVNKLLGGVEESQHIYGYAADVVLTNQMPSSTLFNWCALNLPQYHQLIWEYPERGPWTSSSTPFSWVHISYIKGDNEKINSVSSKDPKIHKAYKDENTFFLDNFTHKIAVANENILK